MKTLLRMTVESRDGHEVGKIRNLVLDPDRGTIRFVLLVPDGILAGRSQIRAVPPQCISSATAKRGVLSIQVTQRKWDAAPVVSAREIATLGGAERAEQFRQYFAPLETALAGELATVSAEERLTATGQTNRNAAPISNRTLLATELIGRAVWNGEREKVGEVLDLLAAFHDHTPVYALITTTRGFGDSRETYAVPLTALQINQDNDITVDWSRDRVRNASWFDETATVTGNINPARWFRYRLPN